MKNKFTIVWIEDNPLFHHSHFSRSESEDKKAVESNKSVQLYPELKLTSELTECFTLRLLQHPEEIKEYLTMSLSAESIGGEACLGELGDVLPDIVVFDYMLNENFDLDNPYAIQYGKEFKTIREKLNPNFQLAKYLRGQGQQPVLFLETLQSTDDYNQDDFIERLNKLEPGEDIDIRAANKDALNLISDELGLVGGLMILKQFRKHLCVGIPASSNKVTVAELHVQSKYMEWLVDDDPDVMINRTDRSSKEWKDVLSESMSTFRSKIRRMILSGDAIPNIDELITYSGLQEDGSLSGIGLTLKTKYQIKSYPLSAMFMDYGNDEKPKIIEVKRFIGDLIVDLVDDKTSSINVFSDAIDASMKIFEVYCDYSRVLQRVNLSRLVFLSRQNKINSIEQKELKSLLLSFKMKEDDNRFTGNSFDIRSIRATNNDSVSEVKYWATLFTMLRLYKYYSEFTILQEESEFTSIGLQEPDIYDYCLALFPCPATPLILPVHNSDSLETFTRAIEKGEIKVPIRQILKLKYHFDSGTSKILKSFAQSIGLQELPSWLTN
jgi:hypothetical protein